MALEASCHVREIVSSSHEDGRAAIFRGWYGAAVVSAEEIATKQRQAKLHIPKHRRQPQPQPPSNFYDPSPENFDKLLSLQNRPPRVRQFFEAYRRLQKEEPDILERYEVSKARFYSSRCSTLLKEHIMLRNRMRTTHNNYRKADRIARAWINIERDLIELRRQFPNDTKPYLERLQQLEESGAFSDLKDDANKVFKDTRHHMWKARDDYRALLREPHVLSWNNRDFEPLLCHPETDFEPHKPMTLLEITPKEEFVRRIDTNARWICFEYVTRELLHKGTWPVQSALERLLGCDADSPDYKGVIAQIPSLTDPLYGGHHDLTEVHTRGLSTDTMIDIALVYEKLPFRRDEGEMVTAIMGVGRINKA